MSISWCNEIRHALTKFIGYDSNYLKSGMYIIVPNTRIFVLLKFLISKFFHNLKSSDY